MLLLVRILWRCFRSYRSTLEVWRSLLECRNPEINIEIRKPSWISGNHVRYPEIKLDIRNQLRYSEIRFETQRLSLKSGNQVWNLDITYEIRWFWNLVRCCCRVGPLGYNIYSILTSSGRGKKITWFDTPPKLLCRAKGSERGIRYRCTTQLPIHCSVMSSKYVASLDYESRKHHLEKLNKDGSAVSMPDPYSIPEQLWNQDVTKWPSIEFGDVYTYLIETRGPFTKDKLKAYKSLEAYNYFYNGYVRTVSMYCCEASLPSWKPRWTLARKLLIKITRHGLQFACWVVA